MRSVAKSWREREERYQYLGKEGRVVSWTRIAEAPVGFKGPYIVVMVELKDKTRVVGQLAGDKVEIGDKVRGGLRRLGKAEKDEVLEYGVKWMK